MMYKHLEDGTHQLSITGPELADITELIVSLDDLGGDAPLIAGKLFNALGFREVYKEYQLTGEKESSFEKVYKRLSDGTFQLTFCDSKYYVIVNLMLSLSDSGDDADLTGRELFNALGFQKAFEEFMNSPEGRDIFMRSSPEEGHA